MVGVIVLAGLVTVLVEFFISYAFFVYSADVRGNRLLPEEQIYEASGIDTFSIFWIQPAAVERTLRDLPYIRAATVRCWLPNRVEIRVEYREPVILWESNEGALWVDQEGKAMKPVTSLPGLVRVEDEKRQAATSDGDMERAIAAGIQRIRQLLPEMDRFNYNQAYGLQFTIPGNIQVYLGSGQDMAYKVQVFDAVRRQIETEGRSVRLIDLRYKDEPYIR
jgi:cell division septal protein FtsQ